jgi:hypothetical protein
LSAPTAECLQTLCGRLTATSTRASCVGVEQGVEEGCDLWIPANNTGATPLEVIGSAWISGRAILL